MAKSAYKKPAITYQQQLALLKSRGLQIPNESKALHLLESISYYRLSGYWYPLLEDKRAHIFKAGANFETAFQLYCFDRKLRQIVAEQLEKIEIAVRARMVYILSHAHGSLWFQNVGLFRDPDKHQQSMGYLEQELRRSDEEFMLAFNAKYSDPVPPAWIALETASFGVLSKLYKNLKPGPERRQVAAYFGLPDSVFDTWLHSIVYLRNICAHHARFWNRPMRIRPQAPRRPRYTWLYNTNVAENRAYYMLSMVLYLLRPISPKTHLAGKIKALLSQYPNVDVTAMGFPPDWKEESLWQ